MDALTAAASNACACSVVFCSVSEPFVVLFVSEPLQPAIASTVSAASTVTRIFFICEFLRNIVNVILFDVM